MASKYMGFRIKLLVNGVRWAPNGKWIATASADGHCRVWEAGTGAEYRTFSRHTDDVNTIAWSPDSTSLVTVSEDGAGRIWSVPRYELSDGLLMHEDHCMSVDWRPHGRPLIASCGEDAYLRLWSENGTSAGSWKYPGALEIVRWHPSGRWLATSCDDGYVRIVNELGDEIAVLGPHRAAVKSVAWSPNGDYIATGAYDGYVRVWRLEDASEVCDYHDTRIWTRALHWSPNGRTLVVGCQGGVPILLEMITSSATKTLIKKKDMRDNLTTGVNSIDCSNGFIVCGVDDGTVRGISLGDMTTRTVASARGRSLVNAVAAKGGVVAYGSFSGSTGLIDLQTGAQGRPVPLGSPINSIAWGARGDRLAIADYNGMLSVMFRVSGLDIELTTQLDLTNGAAIKSLAWIDSSTIAAGATDATVYLIREDGRTIALLKGHGNLINSVAVTRSTNGALLASASRDKTIRIWDLDKLVCTRTLIGHTESVKSVAWRSGSSTQLVSGSYDFDARVWNLDRGLGERGYCSVLPQHTQGVSAVSWGDDKIVTASWDGSISVWDSRALDCSEQLDTVVPLDTVILR